MTQIPDDVRELVQRRSEARSAGDYAAADSLRDQIAAAGWSVRDEPDGGFLLEELPQTVRATRLRADDVPSELGEPPTADVSVHWVCEGWSDDIERAIRAFRAHAGGRDVQFVVADVTDEPPGRWGDGVEVVPLVAGTGWAAARNAGLRRSHGRVVLAMDGSIEPTGDVFSPIEAALGEERIGVCGPFGVSTADLRQFEPTDGPDADAIEGYLMAFRREILDRAGLFDEHYRWYRTADIEWSFRVRDAGYRAVVVPMPVRRHEHRMWFETPPADRARWSKRNFYRFLDRFRDRWDLVRSGPPDGAQEHRDHD
jgi:Glycosyl transferase family 2